MTTSTIVFNKMILFGMGNGLCLPFCAPLTFSELFVVKYLIVEEEIQQWLICGSKKFLLLWYTRYQRTMATTCCLSQYALPENILIN